MGTRSPSCPPSAAGSARVEKPRFLTRAPLSLPPLLSAVSSPSRGAVVAFLGCVRGSEAGEPVSAIDYEAYEAMAERELAAAVRRTEARFGAAVALSHRLGRVPAGEASVAIATAAPHRREAFEACRFMIETLKSKAPIWKTGFKKK